MQQTRNVLSLVFVVQLVKINIAIIIIGIINTFAASDNDTTKWKLFLKRTRASIQCLLKTKTKQPTKQKCSQ